MASSRRSAREKFPLGKAGADVRRLHLDSRFYFEPRDLGCYQPASQEKNTATPLNCVRTISASASAPWQIEKRSFAESHGAPETRAPSAKRAAKQKNSPHAYAQARPAGGTPIRSGRTILLNPPPASKSSAVCRGAADTRDCGTSQSSALDLSRAISE